MLRLGGTRVAEIAHRSMSLPSHTTIRRNTVMRALIVSRLLRLLLRLNKISCLVTAV
jgi:hypothetical protein